MQRALNRAPITADYLRPRRPELRSERRLPPTGASGPLTKRRLPPIIADRIADYRQLQRRSTGSEISHIIRVSTKEESISRASKTRPFCLLRLDSFWLDHVARSLLPFVRFAAARDKNERMPSSARSAMKPPSARRGSSCTPRPSCGSLSNSSPPTRRERRAGIG